MISLFWATNWIDKLLEVRFEFPFLLIDKTTMVFFNSLIMAHTQIPVHRWHLEQGFWHCFTDKLNQSLVSSVAQAIILWDGRENFSHDDGTIIYPHYFGVFYIILSFLSSNKINQIYHLYFFSSSSSKNINSVSSQCLRYDWTLFFAGHCSFRRTLHSVMYMYM